MQLSARILRNPDSLKLFVGQLVSQACDKMMTVGLVWVLTQNHSPDIIPWFLALGALPHLLLSLNAGGWAMAFGPLKTVVRTDLIRGVLFVALGLAWPAVPESAQLPAIFISVFASNIAAAFFNPAILSLPVFLAEATELTQLTALIDSCFSFGNILGPLLSAVLYPWIGLRGLFLFNGLSYFASGVLEATIKAKPQIAGGEGEAGASSKPRLLTVLGKDRLLSFMLGGFLAINLFLGPLLAFLPLFVKTRYHGSIHTLAFLETAVAVGMALGSAALAVLAMESGIGRKIAGSMVSVAAAYLAFVLVPTAWMGAICLVALGCALSLVNVFALTLFQTRPAQRDVPVVMSLVNLISVASLPFSMSVLGLLLPHTDIHSLALFFGGILCVITFLVASNGELRRV